MTAVIVAGIAGTTWFALRAQREARDANEARDLARKSAERTDAVLEIVKSSFRSIDPDEGASADMLAQDVLTRAEENLDSSLLDAKGQAELLETLTSSFAGIGEFTAAISTARRETELLAKIYGPKHPQTTAARQRLAELQLRADKSSIADGPAP